MRDDVPAGDTVEQRRAVHPDDPAADPADEEAQSAVPDGALPESMEADPADVVEDRRIDPLYADEDG
jgi:hypothetical protein